MKSEFAVVILIYKRQESLKRLLDSLSKSIFSTSCDLVFSCEKGVHPEVELMAKKFDWTHGNKELIYAEEKLGVDDHTLKYFQIATCYEFSVLLEDDGFLHPDFFQYSLAVHDFYKSDIEIASYSLYRYHKNYILHTPFHVLEDDSDVFFMQKPSTHGAVFTGLQAQRFLDSLLQNHSAINIPRYIVEWGANNWEFKFSKYLLSENKYVIYPKRSFSSKFGELGVHIKKKYDYHSFHSILSTELGEFRFRKFQNSVLKYDAWYELPCNTFKLSRHILIEEIEIDLNGTKPLNYAKKYTLSSKEVRKGAEVVSHYEDSLVPIEMNVLLNHTGERKIILSETKNFIDGESSSDYWMRNVWSYGISAKKVGALFIRKIKEKFT